MAYCRADRRESKTMAASSFDFESIWSREIVPIEPPNRRGLGTSSVGVVGAGAWPELGVRGRLYVKRQQAFFCRPAWNAFRRTPTLRREMRFIERTRSLGISVPTVVHYEEGSADRALLILEEVTGVADLQRATEGALPRDRREIFENVGEMLAKLHSARILHGAVYPKHLLVETAAPHRIWLIDFEKARRAPSRSRAAERDLERLLRRAPFMTDADVDVLLSAYEGRLFPLLQRRLEGARQRIRDVQSNR